MTRCGWVAVLVAAAVSAALPAQACRVHMPFSPGYVRYADVVVVGRITKYEIVLDQKVRRAQKHALEGQTSFLSDYARFDVSVDEALVGKPPKNLSVTWDNSTFDEPTSMPSGSFLLALRKPDSRAAAVGSPEATGFLTVLQSACSDAFILKDGGQEANAVRSILKGGGQEANAVPSILAVKTIPSLSPPPAAPDLKADRR